jgi:hypothetical protein
MIHSVFRYYQEKNNLLKYSYSNNRGDGMEKERVKYTMSIRVDLLKELKKHAIDADKRYNTIIETAIEAYLKEQRKAGKK